VVISPGAGVDIFAVDVSGRQGKRMHKLGRFRRWEETFLRPRGMKTWSTAGRREERVAVGGGGGGGRVFGRVFAASCGGEQERTRVTATSGRFRGGAVRRAKNHRPVEAYTRRGKGELIKRRFSAIGR